LFRVRPVSDFHRSPLPFCLKGGFSSSERSSRSTLLAGFGLSFTPLFVFRMVLFFPFSFFSPTFQSHFLFPQKTRFKAAVPSLRPQVVSPRLSFFSFLNSLEGHCVPFCHRHSLTSPHFRHFAAFFLSLRFPPFFPRSERCLDHFPAIDES